MPTELTQEVHPGVYFGAVSQDYMLNVPAVVIPIACFDHMTDTEIGKAARIVLPTVNFARALSVADWFNCHGDQKRIPTDLAEERYAQQHELLQSFAGKDPEIDKALCVLRIAQECLERDRTRQREKEAKKLRHIPTRTDLLRRDIQERYENVFIKIGRRDGFHCQACNTSHDLEIDHIVAINNDGNNNMGNLQLLCKSCNCKKGDRE